MGHWLTLRSKGSGSVPGRAPTSSLLLPHHCRLPCACQLAAWALARWRAWEGSSSLQCATLSQEPCTEPASLAEEAGTGGGL